MSAVPPLDPKAQASESEADVAVLLDILYDLVATGGADAAVDVPIAEVERFLHGHARDPRSAEDFLAFFEQHGLPTHQNPTVTGVSVAGQLALVPGSVGAYGVVEGDLEPSLAPVVTPVTPSLPPPLPMPAPPAPARAGTWWLLAGIAVLLGGLLGVGYQTYRAMQDELAQTRAIGAAQQRLIERLDGRTTELQREVSRNGSLIEHVDSRSELLVDSLLPSPLARPED